MNLLVYFGVLLISRFIANALAPKTPSARPAELEDFQIPRAEQGDPVPVVFGSVEIQGPTVVWYGDLGVREIRQDAGGGLIGDVLGGGGDVTVGFRYYMGLHFGLCYGEADTLLTIKGNTKLAWAGDQTSNGTITIDAPNIYGGDEGEGGIVGVADVMFGGATQPANTYLGLVQNGLQPAYRGIVSIVFRGASGYSGDSAGAEALALGGRGGQISVNNRSIKPWSFGVQRILKGWHDQSGPIDAWYPETARILLRGPGILTDNAAENQDAFMMTLPRVEGDIQQGSAGLNFSITPTFNRAVNVFFDDLRDLKNRLGADIEINYGVTVWGETYINVVKADASLDQIEADRATALAAFVGTDYFVNQSALGFVAAHEALTALGVGPNRALSFVTCGRDFAIGGPMFGNPQFEDAARVAETLSIMQPYVESTTTDITRLRMGVADGINDDFEDDEIDNQSDGDIQGFTSGSASTLTDALFGTSVFFSGAFYSMNPAHIIYQALTDPDWGMGEPVSMIDDADFRRAANTFFAESMGLCLQYTRQTAVREFVKHVLDHCGAILFTDPRTGKHRLRPIREDYEAAALDQYDENHIMEVQEFQRPGYGETINEVTVVYVDRVTTQKSAAITGHDLANQYIQGSIVSQTTQYPGLPTAELAARVMERDLLAGSTPVARMRVKMNRVAWALVPSDVVKISWAKLGLESLIMRVLSVDYGTLEDGAITLQLVEDIFGLPASSYSEQQPSGFEPPDNTARPITIQEIFELPYYDIARTSSATELSAADDDLAAIGALAAQAQALSSSYAIWSRIDPADYAQRATGPLTAAAYVSGTVTQDQTVIPYTGPVDIVLAQAGTRIVIGTGRLAEWCELVSIDTSAATITVGRGILDTTPQIHASGTKILFVGNRMGLENVQRTTGDIVEVSLLAIATSGQSQLAEALAVELTMDQRFYRPYPPANLTIDGLSYPDRIDVNSDGFTVAWDHRDRVAQSTSLIAQGDAGVGPEAGTTYNVYVYAIESDDVLLVSYLGLSGTSQLVVIDYEGPISVRVESVRDGIESWQQHICEFDYSFDFLSDDGESDDYLSDDYVSDDIS